MLPDEGDMAPGVLENDQPVQGMMFTPTEPAATIRFGNVTVKVSPM
jgi:hypothetical protein